MNQRDAVQQVNEAFEHLFPDRDPTAPLVLSPGDQLELLGAMVDLVQNACGHRMWPFTGPLTGLFLVWSPYESN